MKAARGAVVVAARGAEVDGALARARRRRRIGQGRRCWWGVPAPPFPRRRGPRFDPPPPPMHVRRDVQLWASDADCDDGGPGSG